MYVPPEEALGCGGDFFFKFLSWVPRVLRVLLLHQRNLPFDISLKKQLWRPSWWWRSRVPELRPSLGVRRADTPTEHVVHGTPQSLFNETAQMMGHPWRGQSL